jgi:hypothetical protein
MIKENVSDVPPEALRELDRLWLLDQIAQHLVQTVSRGAVSQGPNLRLYRGGLRSDPHRLLSAGRSDSIRFNHPVNESTH